MSSIPASDDRAFSLEGYRQLLRGLKAIGYRCATFSDIDCAGRDMVLRHDVDLCLGSAVRIAEIEAEESIQSTYYVLLNTEFYNPASMQGRGALRRLLELGHRIGLHFDAAAFPDRAAELEVAAERECALLENLSGSSVDYISFHRPASQLLGRQGRLAGRLHAYQPAFFKDILYVTDSEGRWRFGHPLDHPDVQQGAALQLLTHPIWWTAPGAGPIEKLEWFRESLAKRTRSNMAMNLKPFAERFGVNGENASPV